MDQMQADFEQVADNGRLLALAKRVRELEEQGTENLIAWQTLAHRLVSCIERVSGVGPLALKQVLPAGPEGGNGTG